MVAPDIMTAGEVQSSLCEILHVVTTLCDRHGVEYVLIGGGCLGIARHNRALIPWDDDLDIAVWAGDMPNFLAAMRHLPARFRLLPEKRPQYPAYKVSDTRTQVDGQTGFDDPCGIFIDVIPMMHWQSLGWKRLDNLLARITAFKEHPYSADWWKQLVKRAVSATALYRLVPLVYRMGLQAMFERMDLRCRLGRIGIISGAIGRPWVGKYPWSTVYPLQRDRLAGVEVLVPNDLNRFLTLRYGADYMKPLEPARRWTHFGEARRVQHPHD